VGDILIGQVEDSQAAPNPENPDAAEFAREGGLKGDKARAESRSAGRRSQIAKEAAMKRWAKDR
jgi:hypothetical protein